MMERLSVSPAAVGERACVWERLASAVADLQVRHVTDGVGCY